MQKMIRGLAVTAGAAAMVAMGGLPAFAATGSWTVSKTHYNVYSDGDLARMDFYKTPTSLPNGGKITSTAYKVAAYGNGNTSDTVKLCYQQVYTTTDYLCTPASVTGAATVTTSAFNGLDPKGTIIVQHTLVGGTYPAIGGTVQDTVTVNYQY